jgi:hypothetical protein
MISTNTTNGFSWKKKGPNSPDFKEKKSKSPDLDDKFQWVAKNIEIFFLF